MLTAPRLFLARTEVTSMAEDTDLMAWAEQRARVLYDGKQVAHRSCGIALAETFGVATPAYQSLRRGGITGCGECGAIKAGELILGELLGDPDPSGPVTDALRAAATRYRELWQQHVQRGASATIICNDLTGQFADFRGPERHAFCTDLASAVARCVAQVLSEQGVEVPRSPLPAR
jgi:hypothetical protein